MLQTKKKIMIFQAQIIIAMSSQQKPSVIYMSTRTDPATKMNYLYAQQFSLPRPIEDATPRAIHHSPNRAYPESSSTCCRNMALAPFYPSVKMKRWIARTKLKFTIHNQNAKYNLQGMLSSQS